MIRKIGFLVSAVALAGSVVLTSPPLVIFSLFGMLMFAFGTPASAMSEEEKAAVKWPTGEDAHSHDDLITDPAYSHLPGNVWHDD